MRKALNFLPLLLAAALPAASSSSPGRGMPDMARTYFQRMNCHNAYDLMSERLASGTTTASAEEIAFAKGYEAAAATEGKTPCPAPPDALAHAAANRILSSANGMKQVGKFLDAGDTAALFEAGTAIVNGKVPGAEPTLGF